MEIDDRSTEELLRSDLWEARADNYKLQAEVGVLKKKLAAAEAALNRILHFATGGCKMGDATRLKCIAMECKATAARAAGGGE